MTSSSQSTSGLALVLSRDRAISKQKTYIAPAARSARAASFDVALVVVTSSINSTRSPATTRSTNAALTFCCRCSHPTSPARASLVHVRTDRDAGKPCASASRSAIRSLWLNARRRRRATASGIGTATSGYQFHWTSSTRADESGSNSVVTPRSFASTIERRAVLAMRKLVRGASIPSGCSSSVQ
jgi:hypothetical protein